MYVGEEVALLQGLEEVDEKSVLDIDAEESVNLLTSKEESYLVL